jgi:hypothetical protein
MAKPLEVKLRRELDERIKRVIEGIEALGAEAGRIEVLALLQSAPPVADQRRRD